MVTRCDANPLRLFSHTHSDSFLPLSLCLSLFLTPSLSFSHSVVDPRTVEPDVHVSLAEKNVQHRSGYSVSTCVLFFGMRLARARPMSLPFDFIEARNPLSVDHASRFEILLSIFRSPRSLFSPRRPPDRACFFLSFNPRFPSASRRALSIGRSTIPSAKDAKDGIVDRVNNHSSSNFSLK